MLRRMTGEQFIGWQRYAEAEPFGEERADIRVGYAASRLAAYWAGKHARVRAADFMPSFRSRRREPVGEKGFQAIKQTFLVLADRNEPREEDDVVGD